MSITILVCMFKNISSSCILYRLDH